MNSHCNISKVPKLLRSLSGQRQREVLWHLNMVIQKVRHSAYIGSGRKGCKFNVDYKTDYMMLQQNLNGKMNYLYTWRHGYRYYFYYWRYFDLILSFWYYRMTLALKWKRITKLFLRFGGPLAERKLKAIIW